MKMSVRLLILVILIELLKTRAIDIQRPLYDRRLVVPMSEQRKIYMDENYQGTMPKGAKQHGRRELAVNLEMDSSKLAHVQRRSSFSLFNVFGNRSPLTLTQNPIRVISDRLISPLSKKLNLNNMTILTNSNLNVKLDNPFVNARHNHRIVDLKGTLNLGINSLLGGSQEVKMSTVTSDVSTVVPKPTPAARFSKSLDAFDRKFYAVTFDKLSSLSPESRRENGMSFVQSGLFLQVALLILLKELDPEAGLEIAQSLDNDLSDIERNQVINDTLGALPVTSDGLKFRWSSRLVVSDRRRFSQEFVSVTAPSLRLAIDTFNGNESNKEISRALNEMVADDSGGTIHDTFEAEDFSEGIRAILLTTVYFRARWRSPPTLLNGSRRFLDSDAPQRAVRMIRINDIVRYANLAAWDAEALEVSYSTPGLSVLMLVPRGNSIRSLAGHASNTSIDDITRKMHPKRISVTLPLYTLRMTLLLPNKLEAMGITHLVNIKNASQNGLFRLSHAVQRIMFWAEAGRNAFKDDGLEWDEAPERVLTVDRPYIFHVRWNNTTLMSGNFVL